MTQLTTEEFISKEEGWDGRKLSQDTWAATWDAIGGCWNIGPGLTKGITRSTTMSTAAIDTAFQKELTPFEADVRAKVKVPLTTNQFTTLVSFAYNVGEGDFDGSTLLRVLNKGNYAAVPGQLKLWIHGHTVKGVVPGLVNRRAAEIRLWNTPDEQVHTLLGASGDYKPLYDPAFPSTVNAKTALMHDNEAASMDTQVSVPLSSTPAIIGQGFQKLLTFLQSVGVGIAVTFANQVDGINLKGTPFWLAAAGVAGIEVYKHYWLQESNDATKDIVNSFENKLKEAQAQAKT